MKHFVYEVDPRNDQTKPVAYKLLSPNRLPEMGLGNSGSLAEQLAAITGLQHPAFSKNTRRDITPLV